MSTNPFSATDLAAPASSEPPPRFRAADAGARMGARMLDNFALGATMVPSLAMFVALGSPQPETSPVAVLLSVVPSAACATALVAWQWYRIANDGTTLGKRAGGIRIVAADGGPPGFLAGVVLREWALGIPKTLFGSAGSLLGIADALMVFSDEGRTIHDRIAGTRVVKGAPIVSREPEVGPDDLDPDLT
jgi:uncharacterized RDD family membrane protein YckC